MHDRVQVALKPDVRIGSPDPLLELLTGNDLARLLEQRFEHFEGLLGKFEADPALAQFARDQVGLEGSE